MNIFRKDKRNIGLCVLLSLFLSLISTVKVLSVESFDIDKAYTTDKFSFQEVNSAKEGMDLQGSILIDRITNDKNIITGRSFKNSVIKFLINDVEYVSSTSDEGNFTLLLEEGILVDVDQINVRVYNYLQEELLNQSFVVHDVLPPVDPKVVGEVNNSDNIIRGFGEPNSFVKIHILDREFVGCVSQNGFFEIDVEDSLRSAKDFTMISYDYFNNCSKFITSKIKDVIVPDKPSIDIVDCDNNFVHGVGEANCDVVIAFDNKQYKSKIDENGNFYVYDDEGSMSNTDFIKVKVIDSGGNSSEEVLFKVQKQNVGRVVLKGLDMDNKTIRDAMVKVRGVGDSYSFNDDKIFNLNSDGNLFLEDLPFGDYELVIRYRTNEHRLEENVLNINLSEDNSEVEILIDWFLYLHMGFRGSDYIEYM